MASQKRQTYEPLAGLQAYLLPYPYAVVDAAVWQQLSYWTRQRSGRVRRRQTSAGSAEYTITAPTTEEEVQMLPVIVRMANIEQTVIGIEHGVPLWQQPLMVQEAARSFLNTLIASVKKNIEAIENYPQAPADIQQTPTDIEITLGELQQQPKQRGRPSMEINAWARQQVAQGRNKQEVLKEYLHRRGVDPSNEQAVRQARERFRKAIERNKWTE